MKRIGERLALATLGISALIQLEDLHWHLNLLSQFQLYLVFLQALLLIFQLRNRRLLMAAALSFAILFGIHPQMSASQSRESAAPSKAIQILSLNVFRDNPKGKEVIRQISESNFDIVALFEISQSWKSDIEKLKNQYPHIRLHPQGNCFGWALLSKIPIQSLEVKQIEDLPFFSARFLIHDEDLQIFGVHPLPPIGKFYSNKNKRQIEGITSWVADSSSSNTVLLGDFNQTIWSKRMQRLQDKTTFRNVRPSFETRNTWPTFLPSVFGVRIDHIFVSKNLRLHESGIFNAIGSDHRGVWAEISL